MKRTTLRAVTVGAVACLVGLAATVSEAQAGWGSYGSSGGSYGSSGGGSSGGWYGSSGGYSSSGGSSGYSSSGGSSGSWGGYGSHGSHGGGLFARWHARWHSHHSYYSSGGSSGGYGSSGGSYYGSSGGGWGSSGGNYGSSGGSYSSYSKGEVYYSSPVQGDKGTIIESGPAIEEEVVKPTSASLTIKVPDEAMVFVNGIQTKSTGSERTYISRGLETGFNYTYEVRAEILRDGQKFEETKVVALRAGSDARLSFELTGDSSAPETTLTLNVPEDAKVYLSDTETKGSGAVREFTTTKLASGQAWDNYTVRVAVERDGNVVTREKTISLKAGEHQNLSFDFEAAQVAAR